MSEYIPRLREELVAAAARELTGRRRRRRRVPARALVPVAATAALLAALAVSLSSLDLAGEERPAVPPEPGVAGLAYQVPSAELAEQAADVMRARIAALGLGGVSVATSGDRVSIAVSREQDRAAVEALAQPGRISVVDWEASILGPDGRARASNTAAGPPLLRAEAEERAEKGDGRVVRAEGGSGWYAISREAPLGNAGVSRAFAATDPRTGEPIVALELTAEGRRAFHALTRSIAERGESLGRGAADPMTAVQHFAIVLDGEVVSVPFIDYRAAPTGIDGSEGMQIQGRLSSQQAREIAAMLDAGPLPAKLAPVTG